MKCSWCGTDPEEAAKSHEGPHTTHCPHYDSGWHIKEEGSVELMERSRVFVVMRVWRYTSDEDDVVAVFDEWEMANEWMKEQRLFRDDKFGNSQCVTYSIEEVPFFQAQDARHRAL